MTPDTIITIGQALIGAIPRIVDLVRAGRDPGSLKLDELISDDALAVLKRARDKAKAFVDTGGGS
jgi:hypothetical protein